MSKEKQDLSDDIIEGMEPIAKEVNQKLSKYFGSWVSDFLDSRRFLMEWRINNIEKIAKNFKDLTKERNLSQKQLNSIKAKFGIEWFDSASLEEDPTIQSMWAKLLAKACSDSNGGSNSYIYINLIKKLSPIDAKLVIAIRGLDHFHIHTSEGDIAKLVDKHVFSEIAIEELYDSVHRLQLAGLLRNGFGGADCFHVTSSLEALMQQIEPRAYPILNPNI